MLRAVSAGAAFLLFLGGRRVGNAGMSVFSVFVRGLRAAKGVWRFFGVLLRIARGKGVLSKPCGTAARAVRGSCEAVRLFRSLRGRCAAKAGLLCFAVYLRGRPMGIRVFGAPLRELTAGRQAHIGVPPTSVPRVGGNWPRGTGISSFFTLFY